MKFGATTIPKVALEELGERWRKLDALPRVDAVWVPDHRFKGWIEAWTALEALSGVTKRVRFGPLVSPLASHRPTALAHAAVHLDEVSGHRVELGVGSGGEWRNLEAWSDELVQLIGEIPLTVGGAGPTALRVAARHAYRWNYSPGREVERDEARRRGRELNAHLDELSDRPILRSALIAYPFTGEDDTPFDELVGAWAAAGFDELIVDDPGPFVAALGEG